jgi:hypothetical protein
VIGWFFALLFPSLEGFMAINLDEDGNETEETEYRSVEDYEVKDFIDNIRYDAEESVKENGLKYNELLQ